MYTYYIREEGDPHARHVNVLYTDFHKACDGLDETIRLLCPDFQPPVRADIKAILELRHRAVYFISQETGDKFILCDLPVIE